MNHDDLMQQIDLLLEGDISEAAFLELEAELTVNPAARKAYYQRLKLHTLLTTPADSDLADLPLSGSNEKNPATEWQNPKHNETEVSGRKKSFKTLPLVSLMGLMGLLLLGFMIFNPSISDPSAPNHLVKAEPIATGYAVITGQSDAQWKGKRLQDGDLVPAGNLQLEAGAVKIELFSGVTVVLEGEANFAIASPMELILESGRLRAQVPEAAQGFTVRTATGDVVDLGTDFAVVAGATASEQTEVHVLSGEVEWHGNESTMQTLHTGEGLKGEQRITAGKAFLGPDEFAQLQAEKQTRWKTMLKQLENEERLIAFFPMDGASRDQTDLSMHTRQGALVAATGSTDRWGSTNGAVDFSPTGSRARLRISGKYQSMTLMCWVQINSLDRWYNSLFLTDGHELHEPHWQIMNDGRLFFSVKAHEPPVPTPQNFKDKHIFYSPVMWDRSKAGKWMHIATTFDQQAGEVAHFIDGVEISREAIPDDMRVTHAHIGNASIGNWNEPKRDDPKFVVRNLNGSIDEFAIWNVALSPEDIAEWVKNSAP